MRSIASGWCASAGRSILILSLGFILRPTAAFAQGSPVIVGPTTQLVWDETSPVAGFTPAQAQGLTYAVTVDATPPAITLSGVTCTAFPPVAPDLSANTCKALASALPLGSHSITMTAANGTNVSLPSAPFAYIDIVIPVPKGLRLQ